MHVDIILFSEKIQGGVFILAGLFIRIYASGRHIRIREVAFIGGMFLVKLNRI